MNAIVAALTVEKMFNDYMVEHVVPAKCDAQRTSYCLRRGMEVFGRQEDAAKITRAHGRLYTDERRKMGVSDATIRREMALIGAAFRHAVKEERLVKAPKFAAPPPAPPRVRFLTRDEYRRLMNLPKHPRLHRFLVLAFSTGARSHAIEELRWSQVDWTRRVIDFRQPGVAYKNKRRAVVPMSDALHVRLQAFYERRTDDYVIGLGDRGKVSNTYQMAKNALAAIGVKEAGVARHVARHTFASWLIQQRTPIFEVAKLLGDTVHMVETVYAHIMPEDLRGAVNRLSA